MGDKSGGAVKTQGEGEEHPQRSLGLFRGGIRLVQSALSFGDSLSSALGPVEWRIAPAEAPIPEIEAGAFNSRYMRSFSLNAPQERADPLVRVGLSGWVRPIEPRNGDRASGILRPEVSTYSRKRFADEFLVR